MGCVNSVQDKQAAGVWNAGGQGARSGHWQAEAAGAVAELLGGGTSAQVEVAVKCRRLPNKDVLSKSDPLAVLLVGDPHGRTWSEVGRTDVVANSLNPDFRQPLVVTYEFERLQPCRLVVYDVDTRAGDVSKLRLEQQDFLAEGRFLLSDLLTAPGQALSIPLTGAQQRPLPGCVALLSAEQLPNTNALVSLTLAGSKLANMDTFSKSDPFVQVSKSREGGAWVPVLKTEVIDNNLNPQWKPFQASMAQLCNCDEHRPLLIEVFDHDASGSHDLIGSCQASLAVLQEAAAAGRALPLVNPKKAGKPGYANSGTLLVRHASVVPRPSFLDYITGREGGAGSRGPGWPESEAALSAACLVCVAPTLQCLPACRCLLAKVACLQPCKAMPACHPAGGVTLNFLVAVDFTASNRDPRDPSSLHYIGQRTTQYEDAISAVGLVLEHYDTDKRFPCWGFGAALPPAGTTSHCFALNGNAGNPEVQGVKGILEAYRQALMSVRLSGPTLFAPIINAAAQHITQLAAEPSPHLQYFVLLILTDGCIMDMQNTLTALVNASNLPLSLLIVGVGNEDFAAMEILDGDDHRLRAPDGRMAARDCVQFVPFRPAARDTVEGLAAKLLAELPGQVVEYFHDMRGVPPPPRPSAPPPAVSAATPEPAAAVGVPVTPATPPANGADRFPRI
ncbi:hypothetical protein ABPG77_011213 [Micractinium sp. CCAP 211/92]